MTTPSSHGPQRPETEHTRWSPGLIGFYLSCAGVALGATIAGGGGGDDRPEEAGDRDDEEDDVHHAARREQACAHHVLALPPQPGAVCERR